ncbi:MAG: glycine cleavage system protein GcvH [Chloroflexi bacterium]|nr:glycine cleavage system protein GcvH [Chloroflexota bacterium]
MNFPSELKYSKEDEWVQVDGNTGTIGITDFAQDQLSDIVYLEITLTEGESGEKGEVFGTVESVKAASDLFLPIGGKILEVNEDLLETPELVNSDPYGAGWLVKIEIADSSELDGLMNASDYETNTKERS